MTDFPLSGATEPLRSVDIPNGALHRLAELDTCEPEPALAIYTEISAALAAALDDVDDEAGAGAGSVNPGPPGAVHGEPAPGS